MLKFLRNVIRKIFHYDCGSFELQHGQHTLHVPTVTCVSAVWIKYKEEGRIDGCGQRQFNWVRCDPRGKGIDFHVQVNTEKCSIDWFAT